MTSFAPGDKVRIAGKAYMAHAFPVGTIVELVRPAAGRRQKGQWNVIGPHPRKPGGMLSQLVDDRDFVLVSSSRQAPRVQSWQEQAEAIQDAEAAAAPELPPHPETIPVDEPSTDKSVLGRYYLLAPTEEIEKAIRNLQFELSQRAYRAAPTKENADV